MTVYVFSTNSLISTDFDNHSRLTVERQGKVFDILQVPKNQFLIKEKLLRKLDPFSCFTLLCLGKILEKNSFSPLSSGVFVGNMLGGWRFGYKELTNLYNKGLARFSPFQATAWFPAAAQGESCIAYQLLGSSKTFSGGILCGLEALEAAYISLKLGRLNVAIAGVSESIDSEFGVIGNLDLILDGDVIGEGAAFLGLTTHLPKNIPAIELSILQKKKDFQKVSQVRESINLLSVSPIVSLLNSINSLEQQKTLVFNDDKRLFQITLRRAYH